MLEKIKELSKDTVIYGVSTIVGRFLNFILVPFYTNIFIPCRLWHYNKRIRIHSNNEYYFHLWNGCFLSPVL